MRFLNCGKSIVLEQLANAYKVGTRTQVWFTDAVVIAGPEPNDPNGPFQFWTPAVLPVLASLLCLYPAWLKLPGEQPSSQLLLAGMVALHLCCLGCSMHAS